MAGNLCNKCPSGYSNQRAVLVIISMRSLVSIKQQSPRRLCNILLANVGPEVVKTAKTVILLINCKNVTFCQECVQSQKMTKMTKTALLGVSQQELCSGVFWPTQSVSPGPGALSSLPWPSPADSSQVRAQEPCPAAQRFRESTNHSGSFLESLQGPGVLASAQGCAQVKPRPCAPPAHRNCAQD